MAAGIVREAYPMIFVEEASVSGGEAVTEKLSI